MPAVGSNSKRGTNLHPSLRSFCGHTNDSSIPLDDICHFCLHLDVMTGIKFALLYEDVQKIPLRHEREKLAVRRKMREVGDLDRFAANLGGEFPHFLMRVL